MWSYALFSSMYTQYWQSSALYGISSFKVCIASLKSFSASSIETSILTKSVWNCWSIKLLTPHSFARYLLHHLLS